MMGILKIDRGSAHRQPMRLLTILTLVIAVQSPIMSRAQTLQISGPHGPLAGTMLAPASSRAPVVLIIPGSGPTDRDGNGPAGLMAATYWQRVWQLAALQASASTSEAYLAAVPPSPTPIP